jgi:hypothetical protein
MPLGFSDEQLATLAQLAAPLPRELRGAFLQVLPTELGSDEVGDNLHRAASAAGAKVQR